MGINKKKTRDIILNRSLITISILLFIRIGTFLPVPGINHSNLAFYIQSHSITKNLISTFSGDDIFVIGLFTLNIFPYINASILVQFILAISPKLAKQQKEGGLEGRRLINRLTRFLTFGWAIIQSLSLAFYLKQILFEWNYRLAFETIIWLTTGAMIVLWLSELITDHGLGNGASILIYTNIISNLPNLTKTIFLKNIESNIQIIICIIIALYGIVFLQEGIRIVPLVASRELSQWRVENSLNYIPLRFNQAGVMPIILTTALLVVPNYISTLGLFPQFDLPVKFEFLNFLYWIIYFALILIFSSFYSLIVLNPKEIADQLQKMSVTVPGLRPGLETAFYFKQTMKRMTWIGAIMLAILASIPNFLESTLNISNLNNLSITSLLILAGVIIDLIREIKNIYYSNIYTNMYQ